MASLAFKVQADRIKSDSEADPGSVNAPTWLALKISAGYDAPPQAPTDETVAALRPWKWLPLVPPAGDATASSYDSIWNPHLSESWAVWTIDHTKQVKWVDPARITIRSHDVRREELLTALDAAIDGIVDAKPGVRPEALCFDPPRDTTDLAGTVPGFVERLAGEAHPLPCAGRVHALLEIAQDGSANFDELRFIAAPRLRWGNGAIDPPHDASTVEVAQVDGRELTAWVYQGTGATAQMVPSLLRTEMESKTAEGRVVDLLEQSVAVIGGEQAYLYSLPTAQSLADLPHRLADAMDPLARVRSVLARVALAWLARDDESKSLRRTLDDDLKGDGGLLKRALDTVAIQLLGQRFDTVGRFEAPMIEALIAEDSPAARYQLAQQLKSLPLIANGGEAVSAAKPVVEADIRPLTPAMLSPFTRDYLRRAVGLEPPADEPQVSQASTEPPLLRALWTAVDTPTPETPGSTRGLRYHELAAQAADATELQLTREARPVPREAEAQTRDVAATAGGEIFVRTSFERVRASAALAYAAPFVEGLVHGRADWWAPETPPEPATALADRLGSAMRALLWSDIPQRRGLYQSLLAGHDDGVIGALLTEIMKAAADEAVLIARRLAFRADPFDRSTPLPLPMTLQIDQLRTFSRTIDVWTRLSGYGLLVQRRGIVAADGASFDGSDATRFVSLNPARLFVGGLSDAEAIGPDGVAMPQGTLVKGETATSAPRDVVDPRAYAPSDQVGVSDAIAEFANSWLTAPMPGYPAVDQRGAQQGAAAARIVAGPPLRAALDHPLPTFSFGYGYSVRGHLVAQGGVLAPSLRDRANPYVFGDLGKLDVTAGTDATLANYVRTTGIGAPAIAHDAPPLPSLVELLAGELPKRLPPVTAPARGLRINYDEESGGPLTDWPAGEGMPALRFEFVTGKIDGVDGEVGLALHDEDGGLWVDTWPLALSGDLAADHERWWRLDVAHDGALVLWRQDVARRAEDELGSAFRAGWTEQRIAPAIKRPPGTEGVYLLLTAGPTMLIEPIRVVPMLKPPSADTVTEPTELSAVAAARSAKSKATDPVLIDGFAFSGRTARSNGMVRASVGAIIVSPGIDRHNWERWANCALFAKDQASRDAVVGKLDALQRTPPPKGEKAATELPDPAVSGLWIELWQIFPRRERVDQPMLFVRASLLGEIRLKARLDAGKVQTVALAGDTVRGTLEPGRVYELRTRAAVARDAKPFDQKRANGDRLGRAVLEGCTAGEMHGEAWLLGQAAILTVEVATSLLPEVSEALKPDQLFRRVSQPAGRSIDLVLPAGLFGETGRTRVRYCASAGLVPQRWSWRGTPRAPAADEAFYDRSDKDVGRTEEGPLHAAHALSLAADAPRVAPEKLPAVLNRDLDWRGGWNLWRFRLRLTSRYAPLFLREADSRVDLPDGGWLAHSERDADNGRTVARPPLALVLPLTEAEDGNGDSVVPPLLALFSGPMHQNGHFGDGLSLAVETARHPLRPFARLEAAAGEPPGAPHDELANLKFLPEVGPDPVRTGRAHSGAAIPLRMEGAIGYGFDGDSDAARYGYAGFIVSPATPKLAPWSMVKLKFRREEDPAGLLYADTAARIATVGSPIRISGTWAVGPGLPPIRHEGIVLDWRCTAGARDGRLEIAMAEQEEVPPVGADAAREAAGGPGAPVGPTARDEAEPQAREDRTGQRIIVTTVRDGDGMTVRAWVLKVGDTETDSDWAAASGQANAGWATLDADVREVELRLTVSARPKPTDGSSQWLPSGEVTLKARVDGAASPDGWLSLFALPLENAGHVPIARDAEIVISGDIAPVVGPIRLSDYTASTWCQFTVPSSRFRVGAAGAEPAMRAIGGLVLTKAKGKTKWRDVVLRDDAGNPCRLAPDEDWGESSVEELRLAVLTEPRYDSLGRLRERPLAVVRLVDGKADGKDCTVCADPVWPAGDAVPPADSEGKWRILRVLIRAGTRFEKLEQLFSEPWDPKDPADSFEPDDATAVALSISLSAQWRAL